MSYGINFERSIGPILLFEGGYVNDPDDPGGETRYGISKRVFPKEDIKELTILRAIELYYENYYIRYNLSMIANAEKVLNILDYAINAGGSRAIRTAQQIVGADIDGVLGQQTAYLVNNDANFVPKYKHARKVYYEYLADKRPRMKKFLKGWLRRVDKLEL